MASREQMVARQKALAEFGEFARRSEDLERVLQEACRIVGEALDTDLSKILEIDQDKQELLVKVCNADCLGRGELDEAVEKGSTDRWRRSTGRSTAASERIASSPEPSRSCAPFRASGRSAPRPS